MVCWKREKPRKRCTPPLKEKQEKGKAFRGTKGEKNQTTML